jgi:hypothetical protein
MVESSKRFCLLWCFLSPMNQLEMPWDQTDQNLWAFSFHSRLPRYQKRIYARASSNSPVNGLPNSLTDLGLCVKKKHYQFDTEFDPGPAHSQTKKFHSLTKWAWIWVGLILFWWLWALFSFVQFIIWRQARMVGVNNQTEQVAGQAQQMVGQTQQPTGGTSCVVFG